jgi:acetoin:2,6-dichlorophenolindophenol oxidoreductase subunit beta
MAEKSMRQALNEALSQEMERDDSIILVGEDIVGGMGGSGEEDAWGGVMGVTKGLYGKFGADRVLDTPISEMAYIGSAVGAAASGLRPVAELMFCDFVGCCLDQVMNQAAKLRYMLGGKAKIPLVIRTQFGGGFSASSQHSQSLYSLFTHIPGLKVVVPSNAYDAKGLLIEAIRDDDPVIFFEHKAMYDDKAEVPDEAYTIAFGEAQFTREGSDLTICATGRMVQLANAAADQLAAEGIQCTVLDPRTLSPLDEESIIESIEETGRFLVVDEANPRCSFAADLGALAAGKAFYALKAPVEYLTAPHTPVPFAPNLEASYIPSEATIVSAARGLVNA